MNNEIKNAEFSMITAKFHNRKRQLLFQELLIALN